MARKKPLKGTYLLIIDLKNNSSIKIGKRGIIEFKKGFYVYVGSALNSLQARVSRHFSQEKKLHWHIDYFLTDENSNIVEVLFYSGIERIECDLALKISEKGKGIEGFGSSDCNCAAHLFYFTEINEAMECCLKSFNEMGLEIKNRIDLFNDAGP
jgi:Uri superfamily endonuclease